MLDKVLLVKTANRVIFNNNDRFGQGWHGMTTFCVLQGPPGRGVWFGGKTDLYIPHH